MDEHRERTAPPMLRGRSAELSTALALLRRVARTGHGALLSIGGEPGIGKTALLREVAEQARRLGYAVGTGKSERIDRIAAGAPLLVALRSGPRPLLDAAEFADLGTRYAGQPIWLVDRIAGLLEERAQRSPVLIGIDDIQWADELTRFALGILPGRLADSPVVWLTTTRDTADDPPDGHRIQLGPLGADVVEELAVERLGATPSARTLRLLETVGGNPFWAVRLIDAVARDGDAELPADLLLGVRDRLSAQGPELLAVLRVCAVWGRPLRAEDAAALLGDLSEAGVLAAAEQGAAQGLLRRDGRVVTFRHDLVREAVYADLSAADRFAAHRLCGRYLLRTGGSPLAAAAHFREGAQPGDTEAVDVLRTAAAAAADTLPQVAAELSRLAFDLVGPDPAARHRIGAECAELLLRVGRGAAAVELVDLLLGEDPEPDARARLQVLAGRALWRMDRLAEIGPRVAAALTDPGISAAARTTLAAAATMALVRVGTSAEASTAAERALTAARAAGDVPAERMALLALAAVARQEGRHALAHRHTHALRELAGAEHLAEEIRCLQLLDRYDEAADLLAGVAEDVPTGVDAPTPDLVHAQMWQDVNLGRLDEAQAQAATLLRLADELGEHAGIRDAASVLSFVALVRGDIGLARARLDAGTRRRSVDASIQVTAARLMRGWIALLDGDAAGAAARFGPLAANARVSREYWPWFPLWMRPFVQAGIATGDHALTREAVALAAIGAQRNPGVASFAGLALQTRGLAEHDPDILGDAVAVLRAGPRPLLLAAALADHGAALLDTGRRAEAVEPLREAQQIYEDLGAALPAAGLDKALADAGARPARRRTRVPRPESGWAALTATERRVAELVAAGHTNRSAAAQLGISQNTVSTHLRSVFAKLDLRSRVQLANALRARRTEPGEVSPAGPAPPPPDRPARPTPGRRSAGP